MLIFKCLIIFFWQLITILFILDQFHKASLLNQVIAYSTNVKL